ncbi:hypothetical protein BC332_29424 [Capsicum chinense]|nr:hypothetical protein BC332_29424 [Capsicum chinense]
MQFGKFSKKKKNKKSNSNTKTAAVIISNGQENFNHISKGKRLLKDNTDHMDIDQVSDILDRDNFTILLWNPSTIESVVLPRIECPPGSLSRFGLGYDSINAFHWVTISSNYFEVVSFNISNEVYGEIPLSEEILSLRPDSRGIGVCVLGGMLCVYSNTSLPSPEEPDWYLNAKPTYLFADGEVLFRCMSYQHIGHTFRTLNGPFRSWPICDTMQGGSAFTESLISPKSLTY